MKNLFILIAIFMATPFFAQSYPFTISGKLVSEKENTPIESATIHLEKIKDSTVISYTISDEKGKFNLKGKSFSKNVRLYISYIGYKTYKKEITLDKNTFLLGNISLKEENMLNEVIITSRAPITVKKDTLEFNVKSFKTKKDANVEDLLKKLPGVEVDTEGKITVNGKPVNKILVNGKPFFGNDPSITTKNLTKEIIEKVQITDTKTKSEAFSGEKGDENNKTINLTIKKEDNKGWFGRVSAGAGTKKKYEGATMINRFNNDQRFSILASTNNINSPGFSFGEIQKMFGNGGGIMFSDNGSFAINGRRFGGDKGIIKSKTLGATFADNYGKTIEMDANYFYSGSNANDASKNNREYTTLDRKYFTNSENKSNNKNDNHTIDLGLDLKLTPSFLINVSPSFIHNIANRSYTRNESSLNNNKLLTNSYSSNSNSESISNNFKNRIAITKKIDTVGSYIKASIRNNINKKSTDTYTKSSIETFGNNATLLNRNQYSDTQNKSIGFSTNFSYNYALIPKKLFLESFYNYEDKQEEDVKKTYDFNTNQQEFNNFNTNLSSDFIYNDIAKKPGLKLKYRAKKWGARVISNFVYRSLENEDKLRPNLNLKKDYKTIEMGASFNYRTKSNASIYLSYNLNNEAPRLQQVQPFQNVTNPLNITTGNPNLKPTNSQRVSFNLSKYNWQAKTGVFIYLSSTLFKDQIVASTDILPNLTRKSTYVNTDGGYNFYGSANYSKKIKLDSISNLKFSLGGRATSNERINILNNFKNTAVTHSYKPNIGITYEYGKFLSITPNYGVNFSNTTYNTSQFPDRDIISHSLRIATKTNFPKQLEWRNDIRYNFNPNLIGFNKSAWFWNATLAYSILKDQGTLTLKAYDILNQNTNARRIATSNYIEDSESTVLQRYFMLGFNWKFNSLGKKGKVEEIDFNF